MRKIPFQIYIFIIAISLYIPGMWWGIPHATAPDRVYAWGSDELAPLGPIAELYSVFLSTSGVYNPQYPLFHYMVQAIFVGPFVISQWITGEMVQPSVEYPFGFSDPVTSLATMTILGRLVNLLLGAGVVVVAFYTGQSLWGRRTGIIAAILVLLLYPMFYYSRTSNVDMGALFWVSMGIAIFANIIKGGLTTSHAIWLGVFAGLATATKDASFAVFVPIAVVLSSNEIIHPLLDGRKNRVAWKKIVIGLVSSLIIYIIASGLLFDIQRYLNHVRYILQGSELGRGNFYFSNPASIQGYINLFGELISRIIDSMGLPVLMFAVIGIFFAWKLSRDTLYIALTVVGVVLLVLVPVRYVLLRFVLPIVYVLALYAAYGFNILFKSKKLLTRNMTLIVLFAICGFSFARGADLTYQMLFDARYTISEWFAENANPGEKIGYYGSSLKLPHLSADIETIPMPGQIGLDEMNDSIQSSPEFVVIIPQQHFEPVHEWTLPEEEYIALVDGSLGYERELWVQTPSLFSKRPITFVNPPVQVFVRSDRMDSLSAGQ